MMAGDDQVITFSRRSFYNANRLKMARHGPVREKRRSRRSAAAGEGTKCGRATGMGGGEETHGPRSPGPPETVCERAVELDQLHDLGQKPVEIQSSAGPPSAEVASYHEFVSSL